MSSLPRSTPEAQGLSSTALDTFVAALDAGDPEIQTVMLLRSGHVVLEEAWSPYRLTDPHLLFSVSKSFTSTAIGLAIDAGLLTLDDPVISFFQADELPATISDNLAAMTVRHLLTMTTGHAKDTVEALGRDRRMVRTFLSLDVEHEPGTVFVYNSGATYMLSAILQRLTGSSLLDYLRPRLFAPLGIDEASWQVSSEGITVGGWGLSTNTESLARFGQLVLQRGVWAGEQLVPAEWFEAATSKQVANDNQENPDWKQGYGFQFWRGRHNTYRGDGAFGQFCLIFPDYDAVLVTTSATNDMQAILTTVWDHLLPALEAKEVTPVPRPTHLHLPPPTTPSIATPSASPNSAPATDSAPPAPATPFADSAVAASVSAATDPAPTAAAPTADAPSAGFGPAARYGRTFRFAANEAGLEAARLDADGTGTFTFSGLEPGATGTVDLVCAPGDWQEHRAVGVLKEADPAIGQRLVTSAYTDGDRFVATIRFLETPFVLTLTCHPPTDTLTIDVTQNVSFGPTAFTLTSM
ncbi:serine hydrolase domain-containing protein [Kribbella sp. CA-247076]|uniref:serine hydrolase domain-containing protein n=1 Tax=Kribbella sp. CA-247076 TaxID=3239941 RepID=UPI003D8CDB46